MSEFTWKPAMTPPPLPTQRAAPELPLPDAAELAAPRAGESAGQWAMSASDRLLPDAVEPRKSRGTKTAVAAAVAVIAGVLLVEMVRRSPPTVPATAAKTASQTTTVATVETVKPARTPPLEQVAAPAQSPANAQPATEEPAAAKPVEKVEVRPEPKAEARASEPVALPQQSSQPAQQVAKPAQPPPPAAVAKEPVKAPVQTGSLPSTATKGPPSAPKVINSHQASGGVASASSPAGKSAATAPAPGGYVKSMPTPRPAPANDAYAPQQTELPMRSAAGPRIPPNDAYSPRSTERTDREELPPVRMSPTSGPVVGLPVPTAPRAPQPFDNAPEEDGFADGPARRPPAPDGREYWRPAPQSERPRFQTSNRPLSPPSVDSRDPYQVRAMAVGLHPQTPPDLLRRLSSVDYRNANIAIQTALAETPDGRSFVWPREQWAEHATYLVRVGRGREPGCRRYVVKIEKDGRTTTTPEMETCSGR